MTNSSTDRNKQERFNVQADTTIYANFGGTHAFKGGFQMDYIAQDILSGNQGNVINLNWGKRLSATSPTGPFGYYEVIATACSRTSGSSRRARSATRTSACSSRTRGRSATSSPLNLGLRTENESVPSYSNDPNLPDPAHEFTFGDKLAPRVGFAWDVTGDGKNKVYGNWGIFYDILKLELGLTSFGGDKWISHYYTLDTPNWDTLDVSGCPPACPGTSSAADRLPAPVQRGHRPEHGPDEAAGVVVRLRA